MAKWKVWIRLTREAETFEELEAQVMRELPADAKIDAEEMR